MKHKILPDSPADVKGIERANEFIRVNILKYDEKDFFKWYGLPGFFCINE